MFRLRLILILVLVGLVFPAVALAFYRNPVNSQPGFTRTPFPNSDDTGAGKMLDGARIIRGSPVVGDLDGNPSNGLEIVIGDRNGKLFALRNNGQVMWTAQVVSCSLRNAEDSLLNGVPALFDIDPSRPGLEVIVGYGKVHQDSACPGGVSAYSATGQQLWNYQIPISQINGMSGVINTPSVADVDGNGDIIIVAGSTDLYLHVLNKDGSLRWKYFAMDTIWSSPALADVNGDGRKDIIVGTDFTPGMVCNPDRITPFPETNSYYEDAKGFLYAFPADPTFVADPLYCARDGGKVIGFGKGFLWRVEFDQSIYSSPAVYDLDNDGHLEVIVGSGCFYGGDPKPGKWVKIFNAANGSLRMTLNAPECVASSPAIGDITGDGRPDIVAAVASGGSVNPPVATPSTGGRLVAWHYDNPDPIWSVVVRGATQEQADMSEPFNNPLIADVDGNGSHEVIVVVQNTVMLYNGAGQELTPSCPTSGPEAQACWFSGKQSMFMWYPIRNTPAIADIDNDGKLEIVVGGSHSRAPDKAFVYVWRDLDQAIPAIARTPGPYPPYSAPWPQFQRDPAHSGAFIRPGIRLNASELRTFADPTRPRSSTVLLRSNDGTPITVTVELDDPHNMLSASLSAVSTSSVASLTSSLAATGRNISATITVDASNKSVGTYTARVIFRPTNSSPVELPVTVTVVEQVYDTYIPITVR
ncbi:MAG: FG-GAP-like repeat-containing protein [Chloroflexus sp.]|nr:FG-GAP-like repeat-containing protein [Chloroflexus sp.]